MPLPIPSPRASGFTASTDVPLYWAAYGPAGAPRLLVLHGGPGAQHDYLLPQMLALADSHEVILYDQRGGGRSKSDAREPITWATHVADLASVATELCAGSLSLVGYSWGGLLALLYAREARRSTALPSVDRMVLIDPAPSSPRHRAAFAAEFARRQASDATVASRAALAASGLRERDPDAYAQRAFELSVAGYFADPAAARDLTPFRVMARVQTSVWESLGEIDLIPDIRGLGVPALVVHGREDPIPLESSVALADALPATLVVLDHCGHVPYVEQPAALFAAVTRFLGEPAPLVTQAEP